MDKIGPRWYRDESGIHVDVELLPEINILVEFNLTENEYNQQIGMLLNWRITRIEQEAKLHFAEKKPFRVIADIVGVSKSQVCNDIADYRRTILKSIGQDIQANGSALGLLVELTVQVASRIQLYWDKYNELQRSSQVLGILLDRTYNRLQKNPNARVTNASTLKDIARERRAIAESQKNTLAQLRAETQQLLNIYEAFGLTSIEALSLVNTGEGYLQQKIDEVKSLMPVLIKIIKLEVTDETQKRNIFGRLANFIRENALSKHLNNSEVDYEFRV
ncbi:MAG: hypothetical protein M0R48_05715 [Candidatus Omnitrophica bacterium]|jgi:hypothetical protein|nr:hypothetical protein [Candidatus Omnitrophota bacterium]